MIRTRLAPTPSGFLHAGNGLNFALAWLLARSRGGIVRLRIDDLDAPRVRPEYVEDIFRCLEWLGLDYDEGPAGPGEQASAYSQRLRLDRYRQGLESLLARGALFACDCARSRLAPGQPYDGHCRPRGLAPGPGKALRLHTPAEAEACWQDAAGLRCLPLGSSLPDFVVWRKDDLPAYQLASLLDDLDHAVSLIVRGEDLAPSTAAQVFLAQAGGWEAFGQVRFWHHPLLLDAQGRKLSKSDGAEALRSWRSGSPARFWQLFARWQGLPEASSAQEARAIFEQRAAF
jgi:glutamyl-tRNA synthetase